MASRAYLQLYSQGNSLLYMPLLWTVEVRERVGESAADCEAMRPASESATIG